LDGGLYNTLHVQGGHPFEDVAREASIAKVEMVQDEVYFDGVEPDTRGVSGSWIPDSDKPYVYNTSACEFEENSTEPWSCDTVFTENKADVPRSDKVYRDEFNSTGFNSTNYLALQMPGLNNLSLRLGLYNKSHGSWNTKYPRQYWKNLGGPYFPVRTYDGFPEHYHVYHKYYAPLVSFMDKVMGLLTEEGIGSDPDALNNMISGIAIGGKIVVTMFDMNITFDLSSQINALVEPVVGLFMSLTSVAINEYLDTVANPVKTATQHPTEAKMERLMAAQGIDEMFGDIMDLGSIPLNLEEVLVGLTFPGIADRTSHSYSPAAKTRDNENRTWDGTAKWDDYNEYNRDPKKINGYIGGLQDPYFTGGSGYTPKETFTKDYAYEWFKQISENWAQSVGQENPYFETHYSIPQLDGSVSYLAGDKIEDPKDWPLKFTSSTLGNRPGRYSTGVITMHAGVLLTFPVGILSGRLAMYTEDPSNDNQPMPFGYVWMDSPINLIDADTLFSNTTILSYLDIKMPEFLLDNPADTNWTYIKDSYRDFGLLADPDDPDYQAKVDTAILALGQAGTVDQYQIDEQGHAADPGWVVIANIRLFEGAGSLKFLKGMIEENFNIHFLAQGELNISVFGYEFYNIFLPYDILQLGDAAEFAEQVDTNGDYGLPAANGTLYNNTEEVEEETFEGTWPHYLLEGDALEFAVSLPIDQILDFESLLDLSGLTDSLGDVQFAGGGITLGMPLDIPNPVPLALWIEDVEIVVEVTGGAYEDSNGNPVPGINDKYWYGSAPPKPGPHPPGSYIPYPRVFSDVHDDNPVNLHVVDTENIPLMNLPAGAGPAVGRLDPFDFRYNSYYGWTTPHTVTLEVEATLSIGGTTQNILIEQVDFGKFLLPEFMGGGPQPVWLWYRVSELNIYVTIPNTLGYQLKLNFDLGDISYWNVMEFEIPTAADLLGGLL